MTATHSIVFGLSHIDVPVVKLERAARFYADGLGFARRGEGEGWIDLDAGSVVVRLIETASKERRASLRIQVAGVDATYRALLASGGRSGYAVTRTPTQEELASVHDPDGNVIIVWRPLSEDEYDHVPELPTATEWAPEGEALLKSLLMAVPALFRGLARRKVVRLAEELYPRHRIGRREVVRAYILSSARITRYRLRDPLLRHGFDPNEFQADFDAD